MIGKSASIDLGHSDNDQLARVIIARALFDRVVLAWSAHRPIEAMSSLRQLNEMVADEVERKDNVSLRLLAACAQVYTAKAMRGKP
jgi:hypothetical protein